MGAALQAGRKESREARACGGDGATRDPEHMSWGLRKGRGRRPQTALQWVADQAHYLRGLQGTGHRLWRRHVWLAVGVQRAPQERCWAAARSGQRSPGAVALGSF